MNLKKLMIPIVLSLALLVGGVVAAIAGYSLVTATSHFVVTEKIEVQYFEVLDQQWHSLPVDGSTVNFGTATIAAGETNSFLVRARNVAANGAVNIKLEIDTTPGLTNSVQCYGSQSTGLEYSTATNSFDFKAVAGADWKVIQVDTLAAGDIAVGTLTPSNYVSRNNVLASYSLTCA